MQTDTSSNDEVDIAKLLGEVLGPVAEVAKDVAAAAKDVDDASKTLGTAVVSQTPAKVNEAGVDAKATKEKKPKETSALDQLQDIAKGAGQALTGLTSSLGSAGGLFTGLGSAVGGISQMLSGVLGPAGAAAGQALGAVASKVGEFINSVKPFVDALAPGTIQLFDQALSNLQATVGVAFEPIFQVLTSLFQRIGGLILPVMQALRPVIDQLSKSISSLLLPIINLLVNSFVGLMPFITNAAQLLVNFINQLKPIIAIFNLLQVVLQPVKELFALLSFQMRFLGGIVGVLAAGLAEAIDAVAIVFKTLFDTIAALLPSFDMKTIFTNLASAITKVVGQFLILVGVIAKFFGADSFIKNLIKNLEPKNGELAAPRNASISSIESVSKEIATAAAAASGTGDSEQEKSFADVVKELKSIQSQGDSKFTQLLTKFDKIISLLGGGDSKDYSPRTDALADVTGILGGGAGGARRLLRRAGL